MMNADSAPAAATTDEREDSPDGPVALKMVHSSPGAATQRTMPPKLLKLRLRRAAVVAEDRDGPVVAATKAVGGAARAAVLGLSGPFVLGEAKAVGVAPAVESRAKIMELIADEALSPA